MKKQLRGVALILFGILLNLAHSSFDSLFSFIGIGWYPDWGLVGLIVGIAGLVIVFLGDGK